MQLAKELSSASAEVSALSREMAARIRDGLDIPSCFQLWIAEARAFAYEALGALTEGIPNVVES
jgi:hypothetical protein